MRAVGVLTSGEENNLKNIKKIQAWAKKRRKGEEKMKKTGSIH